MFENLFLGYWSALSQHRKAWSFLRKHKMLWFFVFPFLLNILVFWSGVYLVSELAEDSLVSIQSWLSNLDLGLDPSSWIFTAIYIFIWIVIRIFYFLLFAYLGGYVVLIFMSPILALITERTQSILAKRGFQFNLLQFVNELFRGVVISIRNFILEILLIVCFFFFGLIPVVGVIAPFALFFITAFYYGFSIMDYNMEHHRMGVADSIRFMRKNRGAVIGIGTPFALVLLIPFLGPFLAGFIAVNASVAGVLEVNRIVDQKMLEK